MVISGRAKCRPRAIAKAMILHSVVANGVEDAVNVASDAVNAASDAVNVASDVVNVASDAVVFEDKGKRPVFLSVQQP